MKLTIAEVRAIIREVLELDEVIEKCGDKWCLYSKKKGKNGKRRRLGTHDTKADAIKQELAIQYSKGEK